MTSITKPFGWLAATNRLCELPPWLKTAYSYLRQLNHRC